jgi:hypothetical protein
MNKYWVALGRKSGGGYYPQSITDNQKFIDSSIRDTSTAVVIEVQFDPETGGVSATVEKNTSTPEKTND